MSQKIKVINDNELHAYPVIVCDECNKEITDAKDGNAIWREARFAHYAAEPKFYEVKHTHKRCNHAFMNVRFREPADHSWVWMSVELQADLFMLLRNTNYNARDAKRVAQIFMSLEA